MNSLTVDPKTGEVTVPEGYKWCPECRALTPHSKGEHSWSSLRCVICGSAHYSPSYDCPNCGWEPDSDDMVGEQTIILHNKGCHCDPEQNGDDAFCGSWAKKIAHEFQQDWMKPFPHRGSYSLPKDKEWYDGFARLDKQWWKAYKVECGCERVVIYHQPWAFDNWIHSTWNDACSNPHVFGGKYRCPICGEIFEWEDTDC